MKISKKKIVLALAVLFAVFFAACSDDSGSGTGAGFASEEDDPSSYIAEKIVPIKNKTISGYAQKGPFRAGSIVDIYELELDGKTFAQTGKSFTGKVANDKGEFKIPNVSLKSQYALLKVTGYFTSEINGEGVRATLTAVTDLSKRENVNVNILTHLEYDRVLALLGKGMNFTSAKKQAGREVLAAFGIGLEENAAAEDLDVSGESDADAALVAISKLVLAGAKSGTTRDEEDLSRLLATIAGSIGENKDGLSIFIEQEIARNIKNNYDWDGGMCRLVNLPSEEAYFYQVYISWKYTRQFCTSALDGKVFDVFKPYNDDDLRHMYFCNDGKWRFIGRTVRSFSSSGVWDTTNVWCEDFVENFGSGKDGEIKKGDITDLDYKYDEKMGKWREIDVLDTLLSTVCTEKHHGEVAKYKDSVYYICDKSGWRIESDIEVDIGKICSENTLGELGKDKMGLSYACYCFDNPVYCRWEKASEITKNVGIGCTKNNIGVIKQASTGVSYKCISGNYKNFAWSERWEEISVLDTLAFVCHSNDNIIGCNTVVFNKKMYVGCDSYYSNPPNIWRMLAIFDDDLYSLKKDSASFYKATDSLNLKLNSLGVVALQGNYEVYPDSLFNLHNATSCSALRDSLQLKQNSP